MGNITYNKNKYQITGRGSGPRDHQARQSNNNDMLLVTVLQDQISLLKDQLKIKDSIETKKTIQTDSIDADIRAAVEDTKKELNNRFKKKEEEYKIVITNLKNISTNAITNDVNKLVNTKVKDKIESLTTSETTLKLRLSELEKVNKNLSLRVVDNEKDVVRLETELRIKDGLIADLRAEALGYKESLYGQHVHPNIDCIEDGTRPKMETAFIDPTDHSVRNVEEHIEVQEEIEVGDKESTLASVNKLKALIGNLPKK